MLLAASRKEKILDELNVLGINETTLFPELENQVRRLKSQQLKKRARSCYKILIIKGVCFLRINTDFEKQKRPARRIRGLLQVMKITSTTGRL